MARVVFLLGLAGALSSAQAKVQFQPGTEELSALQTQDPANYVSVKRLLDQQRLGLLGKQRVVAKKLSAEQEQTFQSSEAMKERQEVIDLNRQLMEERKHWQQEASTDKYDKLSRELTEGSKSRPAAPAAPKKRLSALRVYSSEAEQEAELRLKQKMLPKRTNIARGLSWGAMRAETSRVRENVEDAKSFRRTALTQASARGTNSPADASWGDLLKEFKGVPAERDRAEQEQVHGPLGSFSWGDDEMLAKHGPLKPLNSRKLSMAAKAKKVLEIKMPDEVDMPDELDTFLNGKDETPSLEQPERMAAKKSTGNTYSMDLSN